MQPPLRLEDVLTARSKSDYNALAAHHPDLPPTLEALLQAMDKIGEREATSREGFACILVTHMHHRETSSPSVQLWLLWAFRPAIVAMATKYSQPGRPFDDVMHDATWCLLEALHRVDPATDFLIRNIIRNARKLLRRNYGIDYGSDTPRSVPVEEMLEDGWDLAAPETASYIKDLQLSADDRYLLVGQFLYGYTQNEIAEQLGIKPQALRQRMRRLVARLRGKTK